MRLRGTLPLSANSTDRYEELEVCTLNLVCNVGYTSECNLSYRAVGKHCQYGSEDNVQWQSKLLRGTI